MPYLKRVCRLMKVMVILFFIFAVGSCASRQLDTIGQEDFDQENTAHGAAFLVDALRIRRPMPAHSDWKPVEFYYKHCEETSPRVHYSKTSYACTGPY